MKRTLLVAALAVLPWFLAAQEETTDDFFGDPEALVTEAAPSQVDPTAQFTQSTSGTRLGGSVSSGASWSGSWAGWPDTADLSKDFTQALGYNLATTLNIDGRPTKDFRFHLGLKLGAPFTNDTSVVTGATYSNGYPASHFYPGSPAVAPSVTTTSATVSVPNLKIWELYTDVTLADTVFLRFGKQSASWGVAYFYSPGDVISLTAKDATDPTATREGPVALSATLPLPGLKANLNGYVLLRDDYFPAGQAPTLDELGYALQGDILLGDAQLSLGAFYQKDNAPKAVATINTGLGFLPIPELNKINLFSEGIALYGADVLQGTGTHTLSLPGGISKDVFASIAAYEKKVYFTGTVGASYSNSDLNLSLRGEYWYNPFGSDEAGYAQRAFNTFALSRVTATKSLIDPLNSSGRVYGYGDAANPGVHNVTALVSLSKLLGSEVGLSTLVQQNLSDNSGWARPSFSWSPWDGLSLSAGARVVWGDDGTQFPLLYQDFATGKTRRVTLDVGVNFGTGRF